MEKPEEFLPPIQVQERRAPASLGERTLPVLVAALLLLLDQVTKYIVEAQLPLYTSWAPFPDLADYFRFTHATNTGAAFGLFQGGNAFFMIVATVVAFVIIFYNYVLPAAHRGQRLALGLQFAGAVGNLIDRFRQGHVTDFIDLDVSSIVYIPYISDWPIFNVADASIVSGVLLMIVLIFLEERRAKAAAADTAVAQPAPDAIAESGTYDEFSYHTPADG